MNPVVHFEMPFKDADRARKFYENVFGWETQQLGPEMGSYILATTAKEDSAPEAIRGAINGGFYPLSPDMPAMYPSIVIGVGDIRESMGKVTANGGQVLGEPMEIPGVGHFVSYIDSEGNRNSIIQPIMAGDCPAE